MITPRHSQPFIVALVAAVLLVAGCARNPGPFTVEVMNAFTPVKNQGKSQTCWAYAMLSAIETEHIMRGDSVHLSVSFVEKAVEQEPNAPRTKRGMGQTTLNLIQKYGLVPYDAMPLGDTLRPRRAFMLGEEYTLQEFARSVCAPGEYVGVGSNHNYPYHHIFEPQLPDNWEHNVLMNLTPDELLDVTERAVRQHRGVCWEGDISEPGFCWQEGFAVTTLWCGRTTDDHCMAIVGLARDGNGHPYFIMKNSWGTDNAYGGLLYMSFDYFRMKTIAVYLPADALTPTH